MSLGNKHHEESNQSDYFPRAAAGFTIVELLVAMAVIAILATLTMRTLGDLADRQQFQAEVNDVARSISEQRVKTIASFNDTNYGVHVTASELGLFSSSTPYFDPSQTATITLSYSVAVSSFSDGLSYISFSRITGEPSATGTIDLYSSTLDSTSTITIYDSGLIE